MRATVSTFVLAMLVLLSSSVALSAATDLRLVDAVKNRDAGAARTLLKQKIDVNAAQPDGATALHWAAHWDDVETAELLIRAGARVNAANDYGVTPLSLACTNGNATMVAKLLALGADPNATTAMGVTPLLTAARTGNADVVRLLLAAGADANAKETSASQTPLMWAAAEGHADAVRVLIEGGADVHARSRVYSLLVTRGGRRDEDTIGEMEKGGYTPLLFAARAGALDSARSLIAAGANVNDASPDGASALVIAALSGHAAFAGFLLEEGADPNSEAAGYTALHTAVLRGDLDLVKALLARGANPNAVIKKGTKITRYTSYYELPEDLLGATPFLLAAKFGEPAIMNALATGGADPKVLMPDGSTSLMFAAGVQWQSSNSSPFNRRFQAYFLQAVAEASDESRTLELVKVAADLGVDVNAVNNAGNTAIHGAAAKGFNQVIQFLAGRGARVDVKNKAGKTPHAIAADRPSSPATIDFDATMDLLRKLSMNP